MGASSCCWIAIIRRLRAVEASLFAIRARCGAFLIARIGGYWGAGRFYDDPRLP
jgi:hypothetical protein